MLAKKVETLTKAMEVEAKKMRREVAAMEKEVAAMRVEKDHENRAKRYGNVKGPVSSTQLLPGRYFVIFFHLRSCSWAKLVVSFTECIFMACICYLWIVRIAASI